MEGSKQISYILNKASNQRLAEKDTNNLVTSGQLNKFWIAWTLNEEVSVGMGMSPREGVTIFHRVSISIRVHEISFKTPNSDSFWSIPRQEGEFQDILTICS